MNANSEFEKSGLKWTWPILRY